ncbi:MAG TPA: hypothetical protein VFU15_07115 [Bacteroidia bacterium]|nr:hypothetical protein [Bacteroidia bacterium]
MAEKGRIKVIKDSSGGTLTDKGGNDLDFTQIYITELFLNEGDVVRFDRATINGKPAAINVVHQTIGTITAINDDNCTGIIQEKEPNPNKLGKGVPPNIPFYTPNLKELGFLVGDLVHYQLLYTKAGDIVAVNLVEAG